MAFNSFQIPYDLRVLVEKTVDEARTVNGRVMNSVTQILAIWVTAAPRNEFTIRITATHQWGIRWGSQSVEAALTLVSEIVKAKDLLDLFSIQSRYAYRQIANYDFQTREFGRLIAGATQGIATRDAN
jgi:hypothetical protein